MRRKFLLILINSLCITATSYAQTYLDHLQTKVQGQGTVVVVESEEIDKLVNGESAKSQSTVTPKTDTNVTQTGSKNDKQDEKSEADKKADANKHSTPDLSKYDIDNISETDISNVDMSRKVMRGSYKVNGYRVQIYLGGNSRADKEKAQQARDAIKRSFPEEPVYVHFYSPHWTCRMGNYRTYEEAHKVLQTVRKLGFPSATLLKGKISVQY